MVQSCPATGGMRYGPGSSRVRHNDRGGSSSNTKWSREPEGSGQSLRDQPEDRAQVAKSFVGDRSSDRPEKAAVHSSVGRGRGSRRRISPAYIAAARRLSVCPAGDHPASHALLAASLPATPRDQPVAGRRRRQARQEKVQGLSDRLLPHRYRRSADGGRKALPVRGDRPPLKVRLCSAGRRRHGSFRLHFSQRAHPSRSIHNPHGPDRQRRAVLRPAVAQKRTNGALANAYVRQDLSRAGNRTSADQAEPSLDERPGRANEPNDQGGDRQTLSLREPRPVAPPPRRLPRRLQFRSTAQNPQGPHALRVHLQTMDNRAQTIQPQPAPANAGTKQLPRSAPFPSVRLALVCPQM